MFARIASNRRKTPLPMHTPACRDVWSRDSATLSLVRPYSRFEQLKRRPPLNAPFPHIIFQSSLTVDPLNKKGDSPTKMPEYIIIYQNVPEYVKMCQSP